MPFKGLQENAQHQHQQADGAKNDNDGPCVRRRAAPPWRTAAPAFQPGPDFIWRSHSPALSNIDQSKFVRADGKNARSRADSVRSARRVYKVPHAAPEWEAMEISMAWGSRVAALRGRRPPSWAGQPRCPCGAAPGRVVAPGRRRRWSHRTRAKKRGLTAAAEQVSSYEAAGAQWGETRRVLLDKNENSVV